MYGRYLRRIKFVHSNKPNFTISCTYYGEVFERYSSFLSHLDRKHKQECGQGHSVDQGDNNPDHENDDATALPIENDDQADEEIDDVDQVIDIRKIMKFIALFILKTKEVNLVSQQAIDSMLENTEILVDHCLQTLGTVVLGSMVWIWVKIGGLKEAFYNQSSICETALGPVANKYLYMKYLMEKLNFVVS